MMPYFILLILLQFYAISFAATPSTSTTPSLSSNLSSPAFNTSAGVGTPTTTSRSRSIAILPKPTVLFSTIPGHRHPVPAQPTRARPVPPPVPTAEERPRHRRSPAPIAIVFEVLAGLVGLGILISCVRCCYVYNKTPKRDRIAAVLHRHQLERELEELERNPPPLRRTASNDPVPPYFPPPPTYESVTLTPSATPHQHLGYVGVASDSPPSSPPLPSRQFSRTSADNLSRPMI